MEGVDADLALSGESLGYVDSTEFLGMTLDSKLQWGPHIRALAVKFSYVLIAYAVKKIRQRTNVDMAGLVGTYTIATCKV